MAKRPVVACIIGTRPDAIKTAPVILELKKHSAQVETVVLSTGQHREMLDQVLTTFSFKPDRDLDLMQHGATLAAMSARQLSGLDAACEEFKPDFILGQGDTTTTFIASLVAFYRQIPYGHIEAGLRTHNITNPFPEEFNRRTTALIAHHHYPPTGFAAENLRREGVTERVYVTGNTGIDAVRFVADRIPQTWYENYSGRIVLVTTHRRENWGEPQVNIAEAILEIVRRFQDVQVVVAMHRNPIVRETLIRLLANKDRIDLIEPPEYESFVKLMQRSSLILSDSGGVQEEAPAFGVPVLVLRETTERPEGVAAGASRLIGTDRQNINDVASEILGRAEKDRVVSSPYGDGRASERIVSHVLRHFNLVASAEPDWVG